MALTKYADLAILDAQVASEASSWMKTAHRHAFEYEPRPGFLYVRSRAISSRCNDNFDEFPAQEIRASWQTFIGRPVFVNHRNDNHKRARGVIIDAALHEDVNPDGSPDTWVEVLMEIDAVKFPKLAQRIMDRSIERTSMGCFVPGTPITMADGSQKPIEAIEVGDEVLTHTGKIEPVTYVMERPYSGVVYDVRTYGQANPLVLTPEHPIWIRRTEGSTSCLCGDVFSSKKGLAAHLREVKRWGRDGEHGLGRVQTDRWVEAQDVEEGDFVLTPMPEGVGHPGSRPFARLLGYYLAEGNLGWDRKRSPDSPVFVEWNFHEDETEYIQETIALVATLGYRHVGPYIKNNCATVRCNSPELASQFLMYGGQHSWAKRLHPEVLRWEQDNQRALLMAYFNGDGCYRENRVEAGTASEALAHQLHLLALRSGIEMTPPVKQHSPSAQRVGSRPKYVMQAVLDAPARPLRREVVSLDDHGLWRQVTEVRMRHYEGNVYNFDVEGDDSYVASDAAVHNCDVDYSVCSACGNRATTPLEYCAHIPRMKGKYLRRRTASGTTEDVLVREICYGLRFFENSVLVEDPADPTAYFLGVDDRGLKMSASKTASKTAMADEVPWTIVSIKDTREFVEGPDDKWHPIQGSGDMRQCDRCRKTHEIHAHVRAATGEEYTVGVGCARIGHPELDAPLKSGVSAATTLAKAQAEVTALRTRREHEAQVLKEVERLSPPPVVIADRDDRRVKLATEDGKSYMWKYVDDYDQEAAAREVIEDWRTILAAERLGYQRSWQPWHSAQDMAEAEKRLARAERKVKDLGLKIEGASLMTTASRKTGYGETKAPAEVDTLREATCPVCGEDDTFDGDKCMVCGYIRPPEQFMDPDLDKAKRVDLYKDKAEADSDTLVCDECGAEVKGAPAEPPKKEGAATHIPDRFELKKPKKDDEDEDEKDPKAQEEDKPEAESDSLARTEEDIRTDQEDKGPKTDALSPADPEAQADGEEDAEVLPKAGDQCPECGKGTLRPAAESSKPEDAQEPQEAEGAPKPEDEPAKAPAPSEDASTDQPAPAEEDSGGDKAKSEDEDDDEDDEDPKAKKKPWPPTDNKTGAHVASKQKDQTMRPLLRAAAEQQTRIEAIEQKLARIASLAGVSFEDIDARTARRIATLNRQAAGEEAPVETPAENWPVSSPSDPPFNPPSPPASAPAATTQEAVAPDATTSVDGSAVLTDVSPDATADLMAAQAARRRARLRREAEEILPPAQPESVDVTAPVAGTEVPPSPEEAKLLEDIRTGPPADNSPLADLNPAWTGSTDGATANRKTFAALRLARLRLQADIAEHGDDIEEAMAIEAAMGEGEIRKEIETLSKVVSTASTSMSTQASAPRTQAPVRSKPSLAAAAAISHQAVSGGGSTMDGMDISLFD